MWWGRTTHTLGQDQAGGGDRGIGGGREEGCRIQAEIQHTDWVTDMAMYQTTQSLVTTSNDKYKELLTKASKLIVVKK